MYFLSSFIWSGQGVTWVVVVRFVMGFLWGVEHSLWLPEAVLSQVIFVVSDWEPYLGNHIL
jgi:hypothetical protein